MEKSFQERLIGEMDRLRISDDQCAQLIGCSRPTVIRWRTGVSQPYPAMREAFLSALYNAPHGKDYGVPEEI